MMFAFVCKKNAEKAAAGEVVDDSGPTPITYAGALRIPMVAQYAFAFGFFKLTNYVLFFWLPYFLGIFSTKSEKLDATSLLVMLCIMGILVGGPNNIITSAVAADLASHPSVKGSNKSLGTVTGLINGCGAITAAIGLLAIGPLQEKYGWSSVWLYLIGCTCTGTLLMTPKIYSELFPKVDTHSEIV